MNNKNIIYKKNKTFKILADEQDDIYNLYCIDDKNNEIFYDIAYIPDFNKSVFMNTLFRNIKENNDLDKLEESDDEDEFQSNDNYIKSDVSFFMECMYNNKFKKWIPLNISKEPIVLLKELEIYKK
jgi:hypothetical protein